MKRVFVKSSNAEYSFGIFQTAPSDPNAKRKLIKLPPLEHIPRQSWDQVSSAEEQSDVVADAIARGGDGMEAEDAPRVFGGDLVVAHAPDAAPLPSTVLGLSAVSPESMASAPTWLIGVVSLVGLGALGGAGAKGASPSPQPSANTESDRAVRVQVALGPVVDTRDLVVTLYKADGSVLAGEGGFGTDNVYEFRPEAAYSGKVFVRIEDRGEIADFMDETTGERKNIGTELWAATEVGGQEQTVLMTVSPLSTVAVIKALNAGHVDNVQTLVSSSQAAQADVIQANKALAALFGLGETDLARQAVQFTIDTVGQVSSAFNPYGVALTVISNFRVDPKAAIADLSAHISINNTGVANMLEGPVSEDLRRAAAAPQVAGTEIAAMGAMVDMAAVADTQAPSFGAMEVLNVVMTDGGTTVGTAWASDNFGVSRYQISGGEHAALFEINSRSGALAFKANPDFGALANTADTSSYHINITAHDAAGNSAESALSLRVIEGNHIMTTAKKVFFFKQWGPDAAHAASATAAWYTGLGVTGVTSSTLGLVKERTAAVWAGAANADTAAANVQALANAAAKLMRLANGSLADDRRNDLLESDLRALGIVTNHVGLFNSYLGASNQVAVNTVAKMQTMATAVDRLATAIASGSVGSLTVDDVAALNIRTGLGLDVLVHALKGNSAEATTAAAVQAIALKAAQAMAVVAAYANNDGNNLDDFPAPTVQTLRDLGFDGATDVQLNGLLAHLRRADVGSANVSRMSDIAAIYEDVSANHHSPMFESGDNGSVEENADASAVIYTAQASDADTNAANNTVRYSLKAGVGDAALLSIDEVTGEVRLLTSADYETKASYTFTVVASDNGSPAKSAEKVVTVSVTDVRHTSEQVFEQWQAAATTTEALQGIAKEVVQQRDTVTRDGSGNQASDVLRLDQWVDGVTGTDIVSEQELNQGFVITGRASPGETAIRWRLDNDRTDGINGQDAVELQVGDNDVNSDGRNDVSVTYNNSNGEWSMAFVANSAALKQATPGTAGSGVHQLVVDANGDGALNNGEASRLFLVAAGTAANTQSGAAQHNYSAQDVITGNVFVYYHGDPDGAGTALWTALDGDETPGAEGDRTDQDGDHLDEDFYASDASTELTPGNLAARMRTPVDAQVWEFHAATLQREVQGWAQANALAQNHQLTGSNTGRLASLQEMMALYAANFGGDDAGSMSHATALTPGDVQVMDAELSFNGQWADANDNTPAQWMQRFPESAALYWTAAPSPMGYASVSLSSGQAVDSHSDDTRQMMVVLAGGLPLALPAPVVPPVDPNDSTPPAALTLVAPSIDGLSALPNTTVARKFAIGNLENGATWYYKLGNGDWKQGVGQSFSVPDGEYGANHTVSVKQRDAAGNEGEVTVFSGNLTVASSKLELLNSWLSKIQSLASGGRERFVMVDGELTVLHTFLAEGNTTGHHTFTASGNMTVDYFVLGGGGGGGTAMPNLARSGGGGSAAQLLVGERLSIAAGTTSVIVGAGGRGGKAPGNQSSYGLDGGVSSVFGIEAAKGEGGGTSVDGPQDLDGYNGAGAGQRHGTTLGGTGSSGRNGGNEGGNWNFGGQGGGGAGEGGSGNGIYPGLYVVNNFSGDNRYYAQGGPGGVTSWGVNNQWHERLIFDVGGDTSGFDTNEANLEWANVGGSFSPTSAVGGSGSGGAGAHVFYGSDGAAGIVMIRYDAQIQENSLFELLQSIYVGGYADLRIDNISDYINAISKIDGQITIEGVWNAIDVVAKDKEAPLVELVEGIGNSNQASVLVRSSENGRGYLVKTLGYLDEHASYGAPKIIDENSILSATQSKWKVVDIVAGQVTSILLEGLEDGTYGFYGVDVAGNLSSRSSSTYTLDTSITTPILTSGSGGPSNSVSVSVSESVTPYLVKVAGNGAINVRSLDDILTADATKWKVAPVINAGNRTGVSSISLNGLESGVYKLYAVDMAGNFSSASVGQYSLDATPPEVTLSGGYLQSFAKPTINSNEVGIAYLVKTGGEDAIRVDAVANITAARDSAFNVLNVDQANSSLSMSLEGLEDGEYQLFAVDMVGNLSSPSAQKVVIDNVGPTVTMTGGQGLRKDGLKVQSTELGTIYLVKTGGDGSVQIDGDFNEIFNLPTSKFNFQNVEEKDVDIDFSLAGLETGVYTLYGVDLAGNFSLASSQTFEILEDPSYPGILTIIMPEDDGLLINDKATQNNIASISGLAENHVWEYKIGNGEWINGQGNTFQLPLGVYGANHAVQVRQKNTEGQYSDSAIFDGDIAVVDAAGELRNVLSTIDKYSIGGSESFVLSVGGINAGQLLRLHSFCNAGSYILSNQQSTDIEFQYLAVGGGGAGRGGNWSYGGGGGGGTVVTGTGVVQGNASTTIVVGAGGTQSTPSGSTTAFGQIAIGGGQGSQGLNSGMSGQGGGSGMQAGSLGAGSNAAANSYGGGGAGAGTGGSGQAVMYTGGKGFESDITGEIKYYGGGGGGGSGTQFVNGFGSFVKTLGGDGGGGAGSNSASSSSAIPVGNANVDVQSPYIAGVIGSATSGVRTNAEGDKIYVFFNEVLSDVYIPSAEGFEVKIAGNSIAIDAVKIDGNHFELSIDRLINFGESVELSYTTASAPDDELARDLAGNFVPSFTNAQVLNLVDTVDRTAPILVSAQMNQAGNVLQIAYNELLHKNGPSPSGFVVQDVNSLKTIGVSHVVVNSGVVELVLNESIPRNHVVSWRYVDPSIGNDIAAIQDVVGNDAASTGFGSSSNPNHAHYATVNGVDGLGGGGGGAGNQSGGSNLAGRGGAGGVYARFDVEISEAELLALLQKIENYDENPNNLTQDNLALYLNNVEQAAAIAGNREDWWTIQNLTLVL